MSKKSVSFTLHARDAYKILEVAFSTLINDERNEKNDEGVTSPIQNIRTENLFFDCKFKRLNLFLLLLYLVRMLQLSYLRASIFLLFFFASSLFLLGQKQAPSPLEFSFAEHTKAKEETSFGLEWVQLGPVLNGARVEAVQAHPHQPGIIYAAFGSGGLWKSINNGITWQSIFENVPAMGIGDIALAPSDPNIIYVGTGESLKKPRNFTMPGNGVYRSDDGGENWIHLGLDDTWHIGELVVHPENPDIVLVAALGHFWSPNENRGIFRTIDGGKNWDHVLAIDDHTGANDIVFSPKDPSVLYATVWENYPGITGSQSGVYKSVDAGKTWIKSSNGINISKNTGRIGIAASYQDENKAYVFIDQRNRPSEEGAGEIYVTIDGGLNWKKTHNEKIMSLSVVGWYFVDIYVNPEDDDEIYGLGVRLLHSADGGKSFDFIEGEVKHLNESPAQTLHLDHCEMWINPDNPKELILGNDGGLYHSYDHGESWLHLNNIPTGEFYDVEIDNQIPYNIYGGTQDDATVFGPAEEWSGKFEDKWKYLWIDSWSGGDGCITLVDPNDARTVYFSMQNGGARRRNLNSGESVSIRPKFPKTDKVDLQYNFITPYFLSPHQSNTVYMAGNYVMKSINRGDKWERISPDLIKQRSHTKEEIAAGAMVESAMEQGVLYVGTDRGTLWFSDNDGKNWENRSAGLPEHYIRSIQPSKFSKSRVYLQLTGINYDDLGAYLFVSEDYGKTWTSIKNNLPNQSVNVILEDPTHENILYVGTLRGVYISKDRGAHWSYLGNSMPNVSVADLEIHDGSADLIVGTHGKGIYKMNLVPIYEGLASSEEGSKLFKIAPVSAPKRRDTHRDIDVTTLKKVSISFYLDKGEQVEFQIFDNADSLLYVREFDGQNGFNEWRWDLETSTKDSMLPYFIHYKSYLVTGAYKIKMLTSDGIKEEKFNVID